MAAFQSALMHQGFTALLVFAVLATGWVMVIQWRPELARRAWADRGRLPSEPAARRVLRLGFGVLWIVDGLLQAQPSLVAGLGSKVIVPAAAASPGWVRGLAGWAGAAWSAHPVQAGTAAVWIQVGLGIWMVSAARGRWSRLAGLAGAVWGLAIWACGEAFGGVFAPGLSVLTGAPGAALFYCAAGVLVALPDRSWATAALGRRLLAGLGTFLIAMAVLQAWPGRGFWRGTAYGGPGSVSAAVSRMAAAPQPAPLVRLLNGFASLTAGHGFGVNALAVAALAGIGLCLLSGRRALLGPAVAAAVAFCLADWVLVQDLGVLGGLGTDPNSMIPLLLVIGSGYVAATRTPAPRPAPEPAGTEPTREVSAPAAAVTPVRPIRSGTERLVRQRLVTDRLAAVVASASAQGIVAAWAGALVLVAAASMALTQAGTR